MGFSIALIVFSLLLMLLVLMHKGKGGGLSDMFGGGQLGGSMAGSTVVERNLDRLTVITGVIFIFSTVLLGGLSKSDFAYLEAVYRAGGGDYFDAVAVQPYTYGVDPTDLRMIVGIPVALVAVALIACLVPAQRAARLDPAAILRDEA